MYDIINQSINQSNSAGDSRPGTAVSSDFVAGVRPESENPEDGCMLSTSVLSILECPRNEVAPASIPFAVRKA